MTAAERAVALLKKAHLTLASAESCTGGLIASQITSVPGASAVFRGGVVTYQTDTKSLLLGVDADLLRRKGPVCPEVARQMADGVRILLGADLAVSVTGLAGPDGDGSDAKVGDVYIGFSSPRGTDILELHDPIGRDALRALACQTVLERISLYCQSEGADQFTDSSF